MNADGFWNSPEKAKKVVGDFKTVKAQIEPLESVIKDFEDAVVGYEMAREGNDKELLAEVDESLFNLVRRMEQVELQSLLSSLTTTATALSPFRPATAAPKRTTGPPCSNACISTTGPAWAGRPRNFTARQAPKPAPRKSSTTSAAHSPMAT